jgi:CHASE3 domain sensor protein
MKMHAWPFQKKLTAGSLVIVGLVAITAAMSVYALRTVVASKDEVLAVSETKVIHAARLLAAVDRQAAGFRGFIAFPEERFLEERK